MAAAGFVAARLTEGEIVEDGGARSSCRDFGSATSFFHHAKFIFGIEPGRAAVHPPSHNMVPIKPRTIHRWRVAGDIRLPYCLARLDQNDVVNCGTYCFIGLRSWRNQGFSAVARRSGLGRDVTIPQKPRQRRFKNSIGRPNPPADSSSLQSLRSLPTLLASRRQAEGKRTAKLLAGASFAD